MSLKYLVQTLIRPKN